MSIVAVALTLLCIGIYATSFVDWRRREREDRALIEAIEAETLDVGAYNPTPVGGDLMTLADTLTGCGQGWDTATNTSCLPDAPHRCVRTDVHDVHRCGCGQTIPEPRPTLRVERITVPRVVLHTQCVDARVDRRYQAVCRHCRPALDMPMERAS
jgi:hypothetical protein